MSRLLSRLASRAGPNPVPFDVDVQPNLAVLVFTAALAVLTTILFALVPAVRSTRVELSPGLKENARSPERGGWSLGRPLVIGQLALSVPLLMPAGLFVRSLAHLEALDVGYSPDKLVLVKANVTACTVIQSCIVRLMRSSVSSRATSSTPQPIATRLLDRGPDQLA